MQLFPLPEPPADVVALVLDELRQTRRELADAGRIAHMLALPFPGGNPQPVGLRRLQIEQQVAERRRELWMAEVIRIEDRARALGLDVSAIL
jgi:hypothetical protein